jgi:hypothetical protein
VNLPTADIHRRETQRFPQTDCPARVALVFFHRENDGLEVSCEPHDDASQSGKGNVMKRNKELIPVWVVDYDAARAQAIRWLGDRYLLAKPINRRQDGWGTLPAALRSTPVDVSDAPALSSEH